MPFPARGGGQTSIAKADGEDIITNYTFKHNITITITKQGNFYLLKTKLNRYIYICTSILLCFLWQNQTWLLNK